MGMFYWLATEAEVEGFGFQFDLLESNIINLAITIGVLIYFVGGFMGKIFKERRSTIETQITEAEQRQREAAVALADEQHKLAQAQAEAKKILAAAEENAKAAKEQILAQAILEVQRLEESVSQDTTTRQERLLTELRQRITLMALQQVESELVTRLSDEQIQQQLVDRSITLLGGNS